MELAFEWDEKKAEANLAKHGVTFITAGRMFRNETLEYVDDREDYGEQRWIAIGKVQTEFYRVVFTWRGDYMLRIISAQKASRREQTAYLRNVHA